MSQYSWGLLEPVQESRLTGWRPRFELRRGTDTPAERTRPSGVEPTLSAPITYCSPHAPPAPPVTYSRMSIRVPSARRSSETIALSRCASEKRRESRGFFLKLLGGEEGLLWITGRYRLGRACSGCERPPNGLSSIFRKWTRVVGNHSRDVCLRDRQSHW